MRGIRYKRGKSYVIHVDVLGFEPRAFTRGPTLCGMLSYSQRYGDPCGEIKLDTPNLCGHCKRLARKRGIK